MNVQVLRLGGATIEVPMSTLRHFKVSSWGGGNPEKFQFPRLTAIMSCDRIPDEERERFGHSCAHGPGPHAIRVVVKHPRPRRRAWELRELAQEAEALAAFLREEATPSCSCSRAVHANGRRFCSDCWRELEEIEALAA